MKNVDTYMENPVGDSIDSLDTIPVDIINDGVLWYINRLCFHPRGFALSYDITEKTFALMGNGSEVWTFSSDVDDDKFIVINKLFAFAAEENKHV